MSCDYYVKLNKPVKIEWRCYACSKPINIESKQSLKLHEQCGRERNGEWQIPIALELLGDTN